MTYLHLDIVPLQSSCNRGQPCGDVFECLRTRTGTTLVLADGLGHGVRAHLAAQFITTRIMEKVRRGMSLRRTFFEVIETLEQNRGTDMPWAAFMVLRVNTNGNATVLSYEMPRTLLIARRRADLLPHGNISRGSAVVTQSNCCLVPGDNLLLLSDGITQAGLGNGLPLGWTAEGVVSEVNTQLYRGKPVKEIPAAVLARSNELAGAKQRDDESVILAGCRSGVVVNLLTGPPADPEKDGEVMRSFMQDDGLKIVCGGTTAGVLAREIDAKVTVDASSSGPFTPPRYLIDGVDLATEGAICLNQLYNVFDTPDAAFEQRTAVADLYEMLRSADRVNIMVGNAANQAGDSIQFRQQGILTRPRIVPLLADKLRAAGKMVEVEYV